MNYQQKNPDYRIQESIHKTVMLEKTLFGLDIPTQSPSHTCSRCNGCGSVSRIHKEKSV